MTCCPMSGCQLADQYTLVRWHLLHSITAHGQNCKDNVLCSVPPCGPQHGMPTSLPAFRQINQVAKHRVTAWWAKGPRPTPPLTTTCPLEHRGWCHLTHASNFCCHHPLGAKKRRCLSHAPVAQASDTTMSLSDLHGRRDASAAVVKKHPTSVVAAAWTFTSAWHSGACRQHQQDPARHSKSTHSLHLGNEAFNP